MKRSIFCYILGLVIVLNSCTTDDHIPSEKHARTVLVYMVANNNLFKNAQNNLEDMISASSSLNENLLVYISGPTSSIIPNPELLYVSNGKSTVVKQYDSCNSATANNLNRVISDVIKLYPANNYGLVLWSHGTGWLPPHSFGNVLLQSATSNNHYDPSLFKTFGKEVNSEIEIADLANCLPVKFDYILFDACLMGSIEVYYQLRNSADYIIASPTEILNTGFPYREITPLLFDENMNYYKIAQDYINYYNNQDSYFASATISVTKTAELNQLAHLYHIFNLHRESNFKAIDQLQKYDFLNKTIFYDLDDYIDHIFTRDDALLFKYQLAKTIVYKNTTPYFVNRKINHFGGVSTYILGTSTTLDTNYKELDWYKQTQN